MARTQAELLAELTKRLDAIQMTVERNAGRTDTEFEWLKQEVTELRVVVKELTHTDAKTNERVAVVEQRSAANEKGHDRTWQFTAMAISVLAILVSLIAAFVKR